MADEDPRYAGVERMAGVDAGYLYMETPSMHMHTLKIAVIEPKETFTLERFEEVLAERLDRLPPLQRRAVPVPYGLNHPLWVTDTPDTGHHVVTHTLPGPGGMRELESVVGEIAGTPLRRDRPLWELHVCEGMADGRVAIVAKMHHALADGIAANALLANVTDQAADPPGAEPVPAAPAVEPPGSTQVWWALRDAVRQIAFLPPLLWRTAAAVTAVARHRRRSTVTVPRPVLDAPRTSFNGPLSARRSFATCTLPLDDLKRVKQAHGVTLNDVVLAVVAGALRRWLAGRGEQPNGPLMAGVPVGTDSTDSTDGAPRLGGNRVSNLFTSLATDVDDPSERLQVIARTTSESKVVQRTLGPTMLVDWVQFTPPAPFSAALRAYSRRRTAARHRPPFNVIVSNVRGPGEPVTIADARLTDLYSVGPILEGIGLNVTAWSYVDRLNVSLLTCPDLIPDLRSLTDHLRPALDELLATEGNRP